MTLPGPTRAMERHLTQTRHGFVHTRSYGAGGTPLVLLHMGPLSGRMFERIAPILAEDRRVIAVDRLGYGGSDDLTRPLAFSEYGEATLDALDGLGVDAFDLLGVHTGSCESLWLAANAAQRVRRVAVVGLITFTDEEREAFFSRPQASGFVDVAPDGSHLLRIWRRWCDWRVDGWSLDGVQRCVIDELRAWPQSRWTVPEVFGFPTVEVLRTIRQPLLVIVPTDYLWDSTQRALASAPAGTRVVDIPMTPRTAAPTGLFDIAPAPLAEHIRAFLA